MSNRIETIKTHFHDHKQTYIIGVSCFSFAAITVLYMRSITSQHISRGTSVTAKRGISVLGKNVVMNNVSYISSNRQGPPSWVIRCLETNKIFTSQNAAAEAMDLPSSEISKHLNGLMDHVRGYTFERICLAA